MFKLTVIAGPLRGNAYQLNEGDTVIGRVQGSEILLQSTKVSKKHCVITVSGSTVSLKDAGSSNGTFVNGILSTSKKLNHGDRISIGEFVLELTKVVARKPAALQNQLVSQRPMAQVIPMQNSMTGLADLGAMPPLGTAPMPGMQVQTSAGAAPPKDLIEKVKFYFEKYVINFLYTLNEKHQWNMIVKGLIGLVVVFTAAVSTFPLLDKVQDILLLEGRNRAQALARLMADRNTMAIFEKTETKMDISFAERESGIVSAYLVDMDNRIMAPSKRMNQSLSDGQEGRFSNQARRWFEKNQDKNFFSMPFWKADGSLDATLPALEGNMLGFAEPVKILDPRTNRNVVVAMAIVFLDLNRILIDDASGFIMFLTSIVFGSLMAAAVYVSIHRLTTRPLEHLNKEIDKALRGEIMSVDNPYKIEEFDGLVTVVNTVIQKLGPGGGNGPGGFGGATEHPEDAINPMKFMAQRSSVPMLVLDADKKIACINDNMEEVTGMRSDSVTGSPLENAASDQAFLLMVNDLIGRASVGNPDGVGDTLEFSGVNYQIEVLGVGSPGGNAKGYVISLKLAA